MFSAFENALKKYNRPYILLKGEKEDRLKYAITEIDAILNSKPGLQRYPTK
jgi:hypothetical protein